MDEVVRWRTSTRTQGQGQCVEVGAARRGIGVRDTKHRRGGYLMVCRRKWRAFVADLKSGRLSGSESGAGAFLSSTAVRCRDS
ncbi:hypothetical protein FHX42_000441 [Saccharopolyspora lacisalsi]|uniref:DUF397 domain-containing protein n=1 Tax=Halosaccharopolyspora lacisalsi TaxID=1000566 RepID=A0A839DMC2_9PSEU|nr:DUF397 domain-containing protein [Halosaccharopolyspora lacisalsi]MBA8823112.1 hypothetical protein [Halosaccharopolyspora lacisalsi]